MVLSIKFQNITVSVIPIVNGFLELTPLNGPYALGDQVFIRLAEVFAAEKTRVRGKR